ncbi:MAG: hypothetical protein JWO13_979 [Acidobacteriales bacterium]|nr:hypothetical protein [Terriglobales bacterium]
MRYWLCLMFFILVLSLSCYARVIRVEVVSRTDVAGGKSWGTAGAYEEIIARVYFSVRPENKHNRQIVDIDNADKSKNGEVEFSSDLYLLRPKDSSKANHVLLLEIPNRGGRGLLRIVDGGAPGGVDQEASFGDGWLLNKGYTLAWLGWEWDLGPDARNLKLYAPVAHEKDGKEIHGLVRTDFTLPETREDMPLGHILLGPAGGQSYPVDDRKSPQNVLTVRSSPDGMRKVIPSSEWSFAHTVDGKVLADPYHIHLNDGFHSGEIYELIYSAKNPVVVGLGLAAVRDFVSYLKHDAQAIAPIERAYAAGISQSGRFLRHYVYQDFNVDENDRQVLDGVLAHVAGAGRGSFNHRFAQPSRDAQPMSSIYFPTDLFPFTDLPEKDPDSSERAGVLDAATASHSVPKIFYTNTSYEYWGRAASLIHSSADGRSDAKIPDTTRIYFLAGLQHFSGAFPPVKANPTNLEYTSQQLQNPNPIRWFWRALITDMDEWVREGKTPPENVYPKLSDGTLVSFSQTKFPKVPGVNTPKDMSTAYHLDFGAKWKQGIISKEPPTVGKAFTALVPQSDSDGNDLGGVRLPELQVPLATYTGWNLRDPKIGAPDKRLSFLGSDIPFAKTAAERKQNGDPRPSIAERYASSEEYFAKYAEAVKQLIKERFILAEDLPAMVERGKQEWKDATK